MRTMRDVVSTILIVATTVILGCSTAAEEPAPSFDPPAVAGATTPNLFATADGRLLVSWLEPVGASEEATSTRNGRFALRFASFDGDGWSPARTIAEGDDFFVNWADFPMLIESDGVLAAHWLVRNGGRGTAYDIHIARSLDGGMHWQESIVPHADETPTEHGFVSLVPETQGGFSAIWLDGRKFAAAADPADREMTLRATRFDNTGQQEAVQVLDERICDCCQTSATLVGDTLVAVYRDRSEDEIRDIWSVRRTADGWQQPVPVAHDGWMIPGCPVNGPAIAARNDTAATAWFSMRGGGPEIKVAFTRNAGASFGTPVLLDRAEMDGLDATSPRAVGTLAADEGGSSVPLGRVDVAWIDDERVAVSWVVGRGSVADIVMQTVSVDGTLGQHTILATTSSARASGFPQLARVGDRLALAWTDPDATPSLRMSVFDLPVR